MQKCFASKYATKSLFFSYQKHQHLTVDQFALYSLFAKLPTPPKRPNFAMRTKKYRPNFWVQKRFFWIRIFRSSGIWHRTLNGGMFGTAKKFRRRAFGIDFCERRSQILCNTNLMMKTGREAISPTTHHLLLWSWFICDFIVITVGDYCKYSRRVNWSARNES